MKTITKDATLFDGNGYIQAQDVEVCDYGDTISIGRSEYRKDKLEISENEIVAKTADPAWSVKW